MIIFSGAFFFFSFSTRSFLSSCFICTNSFYFSPSRLTSHSFQSSRFFPFLNVAFPRSEKILDTSDRNTENLQRFPSSSLRFLPPYYYMNFLNISAYLFRKVFSTRSFSTICITRFRILWLTRSVWVTLLTCNLKRDQEIDSNKRTSDYLLLSCFIFVPYLSAWCGCKGYHFLLFDFIFRHQKSFQNI